MIKYFLLFSVLFFNTSWSQTVKIIYEEKIVDDDTKFETKIDAYLTANNKQSLYEENFIKQKTKTGENDQSQTGVLKTQQNPNYFTDLKTGIITYNDFVDYGQNVVVNDKPLFNWAITGKTKEILGYICQEATMHFRSRDYIAYFTVKLPINAGPWKFRGLPGLILEVKSLDGTFEIWAQKIELSKNNTKISWPFEMKKQITFLEFKQLYKKLYEKLNAYRSENGGRISIPKRRTELLVED